MASDPGGRPAALSMLCWGDGCAAAKRRGRSRAGSQGDARGRLLTGSRLPAIPRHADYKFELAVGLGLLDLALELAGQSGELAGRQPSLPGTR